MKRQTRKPARARNSEPARRGPRACWRTRNVAAPCAVCGEYGSPVHMPLNQAGFFCGATCCPVCARSQNKIKDQPPTEIR